MQQSSVFGENFHNLDQLSPQNVDIENLALMPPPPPPQYHILTPVYIIIKHYLSN
jgi:hypothetical protein